MVTTDALGCASTISAPFQVIHTGVTTIETRSSRLVPNPASDQVRIERTDTRPATLTITDVQGRIVREETISGSRHNVELAGLKAGVYLLRIATASELETLRLVKD